MKKAGLVGLGLTLMLTLPILFVLTRSAVSTNQFIVILFLIWTVLYALLVDPLLRRLVGNIFNVRIEWRGSSKSIAWTPIESQGCLSEMVVALLGWTFVILWILPFAIMVFFVYRARHQSQF
jgi:hypothetical protein